jgi:hypothetical protein
MGVSSRSAIVLEFGCPFLGQRASYPLERDLILGRGFVSMIEKPIEKPPMGYKKSG